MEANLICVNCKHFEGKSFSCKAYPNGIDNDDIISGESDHSKIMSDQQSEVVFEAIEADED